MCSNSFLYLSCLFLYVCLLHDSPSMTAGFYFLVHRDGNVGRWIHHFGPDWMTNDLPGKLLQIFKVSRWRWSHPDFYCLTMGLIFAFHSEISQLLGGFEMKFGTFVHSCSPQETPGMDCNNFGDLLTFPLLCQHQVKFTFIIMLTV